MIKQFYAVTALITPTRTDSISVYDISVTDDGEVIMEKIGLKGESSIKVGDKLGSGNESCQRTLGVTYDFGLQRYERLGHRRVDQVNTISFGGGTTKIVGLFDEKEPALSCLKKRNLTLWDKRFLEYSVSIIERVGTEAITPINLDSTLCNALEQNRLLDLLKSKNN